LQKKLALEEKKAATLQQKLVQQAKGGKNSAGTKPLSAQLAKVKTALTKALGQAKTKGSQVAKLSAQLKSAPKASSATEKALQKKLVLEEKKAATLQQKLVQQAQGLKRDMSAKDDLLKKQSSKLKVAGTLQDELKKAQAKIATLSKPAPALKVSGAMKKMVNNLKKTASEEHTQALDAVEKAKRFAAQVAADPHSTIKDITSAQKGIDDAQRTFAKARVAEAKAHGAKQLLHQAKAK